MTDIEKEAKEYADSITGENDVLDIGYMSEYEYHSMLEQSFIAGAKRHSDSNKWHDLELDQKDLPLCDKSVICVTTAKTSTGVCQLLEDNSGKTNWITQYCGGWSLLNSEYKVLKWKYIE